MIKRESYLLSSLVTFHRHLNPGIVGYGQEDVIF
jgi:hypothetical protein